jgi:hypothetical protein
MMDAHIGRPVSERPLLVWVGEIRLVDGLDETLRQVLDVNELVQHAVPAHNYLLSIPLENSAEQRSHRNHDATDRMLVLLPSVPVFPRNSLAQSRMNRGRSMACLPARCNQSTHATTEIADKAPLIGINSV